MAARGLPKINKGLPGVFVSLDLPFVKDTIKVISGLEFLQLRIKSIFVLSQPVVEGATCHKHNKSEYQFVEKYFRDLVSVTDVILTRAASRHDRLLLAFSSIWSTSALDRRITACR